jgi:phospholipase/carboxylesterase
VTLVRWSRKRRSAGGTHVVATAALLVAVLAGVPGEAWSAGPSKASGSVGAASAAGAAAAHSANRARENPVVEEVVGELEYVERLSGDAKPTDVLPMVVAVHGLGDRPESFALLLAGLESKARIILPRGPSPWGQGFAWFPFRSADGDDTESARGIARSADLLVELIARLRRTLPTAGRPVITGFSQGGMLSYAVAMRHPQAVSMAVPVSGFLPASLWPQPSRPRLAEKGAVPSVRAFHGEADKVVPIEPARWTIAVMQDQGMDASLTAYPGVGHTVAAGMRRDLLTVLDAAVAEEASKGTSMAVPSELWPVDPFPAPALPEAPAPAQ